MDGFIGEVRVFPFGFQPMYWAICNGALVQIQQQTALFSIIGNRFGGDGVTTFALPNFQAQSALGVGAAPGLTPRTMGQQVGEPTVTLSTNQLPAHTHTTHARLSDDTSQLSQTPSPQAWLSRVAAVTNGGISAVAESFVPAGSVPNPPDTTLSPTSISPSGGGGAHENRQPVLAMNFCICVEGVYPS